MGAEEVPGTPRPLLTRLAQVSSFLASDLYPDPDFVSLYPLTFLPSCQFRVVGPQHVKWPSVLISGLRPGKHPSPAESS